MSKAILRAFWQALVTLLAALATLFSALALDAEAGPAILGVVLCLSLSRSQLDLDRRGRLEAAIALPIVSLAALGVARLLHERPTVGAASFVAAITLSIWLRRFGPDGRKAGSLIALPFVVILVTPHVALKQVSAAMALALPVMVALIALFWVSLFHAVARRLGWLAPEAAPPPTSGIIKSKPSEPDSPASATAGAAATRRIKLLASTRMALQMGTALTLAFAVGYSLFIHHWGWLVLTTFIVGSGNQGRLDVAYKSLLRILGAGAGTVLAMALGKHLGAHDLATVVLILVAIFLGVWLRPLGYGWWALCVTLALALLQGFEGAASPASLWPRMLGIVLGALIGVLSAWFVLPVRSTDVMRRRLADVLAALSDALDPASPERSAGRFLAQLHAVERLAPSFRAARVLTRHWRPLQPADWVDQLQACRGPALAWIEKGGAPGTVRKALGAARKALRDGPAIAPALEELRRALQG